MLLSSASLVLLALFSSVAAVPTKVQNPRSFPSSNGQTCYYTCPASIDGYQLANSGTDSMVQDGRTAIGCPYTISSSTQRCYFWADTGVVLDNVGPGLCEDAIQAPLAGCGDDYSTGAYNFKRSVARRAQSAGQELIRSLQWSPKRER